MYRNFYLGMTTRITPSADLSLIYFTCCWRQEVIPWPGETVSLINNFDLSARERDWGGVGWGGGWGGGGVGH